MKDLDRAVIALCEHDWAVNAVPDVTDAEMARLVGILSKELEQTGTYYVPSVPDMYCTICNAQDRKFSDWIRMRVEKDVPPVEVLNTSYTGIEKKDVWAIAYPNASYTFYGGYVTPRWPR